VGSAHRKGPRFKEADRARLQGLESGANTGPTLRGWLIGLFSCGLMSLLIPFIEYRIAPQGTRLTLNLLPVSSVFILMGCIFCFNLVLARLSTFFTLTRQDLALIFAMTMLINPLPACGFFSYYAGEVLGPVGYASPDNKWEENLLPRIPQELRPVDPSIALKDTKDEQPSKWFFNGLPERQAIPWAALLKPYAYWCVALVFVLAMLFAACLLLHRQWSERERLSFPMAQIPELMMSGLGGERGQKPFFHSRLAWWGIGIVFALHSWNALADYSGLWPPIPLRIDNIDRDYLTEEPWRHLNPVYMCIYPSVIGIMYLISLEVSFSLWFFFIVVLKICLLIAVKGFGMGQDQWFFAALEGQQSVFTAQGTGACFAMVLVSLFMARALLWRSLKQALGLAPSDPADGISPRATWLALLIGYGGSVLWLCWAGVTWYWAAAGVLILLMTVLGIARLVAEGGVFFLQMQANPAENLAGWFTPQALGPQNLVSLSLWSRIFVFDWYRSNPAINIFSALQLATLTRLRTRPLVCGLIAALVLVFSISFFSLHYVAYKTDGGLRGLNTWEFNSQPPSEFTGLNAKLEHMAAFEEKKKKFAEKDEEVPLEDVPNEARLDTTRLWWTAIGAIVMTFFLFMRTRVLWWPHPIGYVMWMCVWPIMRMWFSYFLGWGIKALIVKFGGQKVYLEWRPFFIGLIVGEALAVIFWLLMDFLTHTAMHYPMHYN